MLDISVKFTLAVLSLLAACRTSWETLNARLIVVSVVWKRITPILVLDSYAG